jgi:hypothetical protein
MIKTNPVSCESKFTTSTDQQNLTEAKPFNLFLPNLTLMESSHYMSVQEFQRFGLPGVSGNLQAYNIKSCKHYEIKTL